MTLTESSMVFDIVSSLYTMSKASHIRSEKVGHGH